MTMLDILFLLEESETKGLGRNQTLVMSASNGTSSSGFSTPICWYGSMGS